VSESSESVEAVNTVSTRDDIWPYVGKAALVGFITEIDSEATDRIAENLYSIGVIERFRPVLIRALVSASDSGGARRHNAMARAMEQSLWEKYSLVSLVDPEPAPMELGDITYRTRHIYDALPRHIYDALYKVLRGFDEKAEEHKAYFKLREQPLFPPSYVILTDPFYPELEDGSVVDIHQVGVRTRDKTQER